MLQIWRMIQGKQSAQTPALLVLSEKKKNLQATKNKSKIGEGPSILKMNVELIRVHPAA